MNTQPKGKKKQHEPQGPGLLKQGITLLIKQAALLPMGM